MKDDLCPRFADFSELSLECTLMNTTLHTSMPSLNSKTATRLVREWIDIRLSEMEENWELARAGKEVKKIAPLE